MQNLVELEERFFGKLEVFGEVVAPADRLAIDLAEDGADDSAVDGLDVLASVLNDCHVFDVADADFTVVTDLDLVLVFEEIVEDVDVELVVAVVKDQTFIEIKLIPPDELVALLIALERIFQVEEAAFEVRFYLDLAQLVNDHLLDKLVVKQEELGVLRKLHEIHLVKLRYRRRRLLGLDLILVVFEISQVKLLANVRRQLLLDVLKFFPEHGKRNVVLIFVWLHRVIVESGLVDELAVTREDHESLPDLHQNVAVFHERGHVHEVLGVVDQGLAGGFWHVNNRHEGVELVLPEHAVELVGTPKFDRAFHHLLLGFGHVLLNQLVGLEDAVWVWLVLQVIEVEDLGAKDCEVFCQNQVVKLLRFVVQLQDLLHCRLVLHY